jgi:hypothetical protein
MITERWAFDVELLYLAQQLNMPIEEVPPPPKRGAGVIIFEVLTCCCLGRERRCPSTGRRSPVQR